MNRERYELDTRVRLKASSWWWVAAFVAPLGLFAVAHDKPLGLGAFALFALLSLAARTPRERRATISASAEGLRIGERLVPARDLGMALVRHAGRGTFVALRGRERIDVEVPNNVEGDALVHALGLDAASSTIELSLTAPLSARGVLVLFAALILSAVNALYFAVFAAFLASALALLSLAVAAWLATRVRLRVGADGIVLRRPFRRDRFLAHDALTNVRADDDTILVQPQTGRELTLQIPGRGLSDENRSADLARRSDEAAAVVRRIHQARRAFREHAAGVGAIAAVLGRGERSARQWLEELRRIGDGAAGTFRSMGVARAQLLEIVESTTATARDRVAAAVALRGQLTDDERPRIRVAADRCAQKELGTRLLRVVETDDEDAIAEELERLDAEK